MTDSFRPVPMGALIASSLLLGALHAVLLAVPTAAARLLVPGAGGDLGHLACFAVVTGLVASVGIALADRPVTYAQRTISPYGPLVALSHLLVPLLTGALVGWAALGRRWFWAGGACALLTYLVQFFMLTPWKKTVDDEDLRRRSREFADVTRDYVDEYKSDLRDLSQQRAQRKHDEQQERLRRERQRS